MDSKDFKTEWCLLQEQFDSYEKHSLYIKLLSIIIFSAVEVLEVITIFTMVIFLVLWLQDAIWKTFQSRIESRLLQVERCILEKNKSDSFQFNSEFHKVRTTGLSLINEYFSQSIRPTIAFPHIMLVLILLIQY
ncbi:MAG: hypothetical protein JJV99_08725 [Colwellia sp.]|nr:hypothetical protein [Colwellia sp.]